MLTSNIHAINVLAVIYLLSGCTSDPHSHKATVGEAQQVAEIASNAVHYQIDTSVSHITWVGTKPTGRHHGTISISHGNISITNNKITGGYLEIDISKIEVLDLEKGSEDYQKLTNHLRSRDFFDVQKFPVASFTITAFKNINEAMKNEFADLNNDFIIVDPTHVVIGNLTIKEITLGIEFPSKINQAPDKISAVSKFNIDRTGWGISFNEESKFVHKAKDGLIYNMVNVGFDITAKKTSY